MLSCLKVVLVKHVFCGSFTNFSSNLPSLTQKYNVNDLSMDGRDLEGLGKSKEGGGRWM